MLFRSNNELDSIVEEARRSFATAATPADLENAKALFLGKQGRVTELMKGLAALSVDEKKSRGAAINQIKQAVESVFGVRVLAVTTANRQGKRIRTRTGFGQRAATKRAIVSVATGERIDIFGGPVS